MKPKFTEEELQGMDDLHSNFGRQQGWYEVIAFLKEKFGWSEVHNVITELRKEFHNKRAIEIQKKFQETYKDSTLINTLCKRMDYTAKEKEKKLPAGELFDLNPPSGPNDI